MTSGVYKRTKINRINVGLAKIGKKNPQWKGNKVKYGPLHDWIKDHKLKSLSCENCRKISPKLDVANISGEYHRDINDFKWLCRKCHMIEDGRLKQLRLNYKPRLKKSFRLICLNCGKEFYVVSSLMNKRKFCNKKCDNQSRKGKIPWNKGLRKETDERVKKYSKNNITKVL